jgi:hypothetical protein
VYCLNNPLRWIDKDGRDPGDPFKTPAEAALDFAKYYNGTSIVRNREFVSMVYKTEVDGKTTYSYTNANIGSASRAIIPDEEIPTGATSIAIAHTHSKYDPLSPNPHETNNNFSDTDKKAADQRKVDNYVATPDGSVKKYDTKTQKTNDLGSKDIPSDPNDPKRRNKTDPKDTNPTYNDPSGIDKIDKLKELLDK